MLFSLFGLSVYQCPTEQHCSLKQTHTL